MHTPLVHQPVLSSTDTIDDNTGNQVKWRFIDRQTYKGIKENRHAATGNLLDVWYRDTEVSKCLSESSYEYICMINQFLKTVLLGECYVEVCKFTVNQTYLEKQSKGYLNDQDHDNSPFYEILLTDSENITVIVGRGFLYHVTQSKGNLLAFVLACLRCLDHFNCSSMQLNKLYLRLNYVKDYHVLIGTHAQS